MVRSVEELKQYFSKPLLRRLVNRQFKTFSTVNPNRLHRCYRKLTLNDHAVVILLHYGQLQNPHQIIYTISQISRMLSIPNGTVQHIIKRFKENGNNLESRRSRCGRKVQRLPANVETYLTSQAGLQECAGLSLTDRVEFINHKFQFRMSRATLARTYKRSGISYSKAQLSYSQSIDNLNLLEM